MAAIFKSINPKNNKLHRTFEAVSNKDLDGVVDRSYQRFRYKYAQGHSRLMRRFEKMGYLKSILTENKSMYAGLMTQEMGKPIVQAEAEIDKCISHLDYYIQNSERFLEDEVLKLSNPNH
jgi:succinate-semialdehyde dehydrogenase / glutarate-semialdehyde dehydrogenase